jgi:hypothetical protein
LGLSAPLCAETPAAAAAAPQAGAQKADVQKAELKALDLEIARFDALSDTIPDVQQKAATRAFLDGFKDRRVALRMAFDHDAYLDLRWEIDVEYQRLVVWLGAPTITIPAARAANVPGTPVIYLLNPSSSDRAGVAAALDAVDREIRRLEDRCETLPSDPAAAVERLRINSIRERRRALGKGFTKAGWDALIAIMRNQ